MVVGRIPCVVPWCRRTMKQRTPQAKEFICGRHWSATSRTLRRRLFMFRRLHLWYIAARIWDRLRTQAIERAVGL